MALSLNSCDFFRSLVGKPTSAELEQMRMEAEKKAARERFVADSIKAAEEARRLAAQEMDKVTNNDPRYNVIYGCFKVTENATNFRAFLEKNGLSPKRLVFKSGYDVVCVYQSDDLLDACRAMGKMMETETCPEDVWIYDLNQGLHE